ncbi:hypothetical protein TWF569_008984 [Orbilia oligospora]|uniref:Uncharacterized protein n=1 Tax=Orbilia oligospora TaxID=2813651 RepID=A0A7C8J7R1_ORBOL|nr:hypothetical protein TWF102_008371 [Orbilia oligospora]KAF3096282.1 hypothetical protein TWF103_009855 [Orbilia oligospora]KAF3097963.1 hypothetical protein TWF706_006905 [Orbilia oligospora]KAF3145422.1 hypothetical protein TWF594_004359 [Orbilia oligospora]KAF3155622.1 hypothetical protein TWF569_008984 [Orbilia oligospora]
MPRVSTPLALLTGSIYAFSKFAPLHLRQPALDLLTPHLSDKALSRLLLLCASTFAITTVAKSILGVSSWFSRNSENNWVEDKYDWDSELVLITGASSGFGEKIAAKLATGGTKVVTVDKNGLGPQLQTYKNVHHYQVDITDWEALGSAVEQIKVEHGDPTVLILNAGICHKIPILNKDFSKIRALIDINLTSHLAMLQHFLPAMVKNNHGHIMSLGSLSSYIPIPGAADYSATKSGLCALHEALRLELRHIYKANKVRTSLVHPLWTHTPLIKDFEPDLKELGLPTLQLDETIDPIVGQLYSGYGGTLIVPNHLGFATGIRG